MTTLDRDQTLAAVAAHPAAARTLEQFGLDYCCGGQRTLDEACAAAGLDPEAVIDALATLPSLPVDDPGWTTMGPGELVEHVQSTHHAYLHTELPRLASLADMVTRVHGDRYPESPAVRATFEELRAELEPHLAKEESVLFPMIRQLASSGSVPVLHCGGLRGPISVMLVEHDRAGDLLARLREQTHAYHTPEDGCASSRAFYEGLAELEADTHLHVHKENNLLFPAVLALEESRASRA